MTKKPLCIGARLALGCGAFFLLMMVLAAAAIGRVGEIERALKHINAVTSVKQRYAINFRNSVQDRATTLRDIVLAADAAQASAPIGLIKSLDDDYARSASPMDALFHELPDILPAEKEALAAIKEQERRTRPLVERVIALHAAGQAAEAATLLSQQAAPAFVDWLASINGFLALQEKLGNEHTAAARRVASGFSGWMVLLCISAIVAGGLGAWVLGRGLQRQLARDAAAALQASEAVLRGGTDMSRVVDTMASINASSSKIVDLIGVVDGLAFQTTILALNAAVDAVRAGEQGQVVAAAASEMRLLAQRSAAAAKEIRELIGSSAERVEAGARLVDDAGAKMGEIAAAVRRVTGLLAGIAQPGAGQAGDIAHGDYPIGQMDDAARLNAVLVRQATYAVASLEAQSCHMAQMAAAVRPGAAPQASRLESTEY